MSESNSQFVASSGYQSDESSKKGWKMWLPVGSKPRYSVSAQPTRPRSINETVGNLTGSPQSEEFNNASVQSRLILPISIKRTIQEGPRGPVLPRDSDDGRCTISHYDAGLTPLIRADVARSPCLGA